MTSDSYWQSYQRAHLTGFYFADQKSVGVHKFLSSFGDYNRKDVGNGEVFVFQIIEKYATTSVFGEIFESFHNGVARTLQVSKMGSLETIGNG